MKAPRFFRKLIGKWRVWRMKKNHVHRLGKVPVRKILLFQDELVDALIVAEREGHMGEIDIAKERLEVIKRIVGYAAEENKQ